MQAGGGMGGWAESRGRGGVYERKEVSFLLGRKVSSAAAAEQMSPADRFMGAGKLAQMSLGRVVCVSTQLDPRMYRG